MALWTGMHTGDVGRLLVHSPQGCVAPGLGSILGSLHCTLLLLTPLHCREKRSLSWKSLWQQFPAGGRRASSVLTEFPGTIYGEVLKHEIPGSWGRKKAGEWERFRWQEWGVDTSWAAFPDCTLLRIIIFWWTPSLGVWPTNSFKPRC